MKRNSLLIATTTCLIISCSGPTINSNKKAIPKPESNNQISELELLEPGDIGSAFDGDRDKRLAFLTKEIDSKRKEATKLKKAKGLNETAKLELEILTNEMLLLEAEKFGLEDGLDLRQPSDD